MSTRSLMIGVDASSFPMVAVVAPDWTASARRRRSSCLYRPAGAPRARFGGTLTGEHGIRQSNRKYLPLEFDAVALGLMRASSAPSIPTTS
jgi:FAD/FMN-containing dehydrogenase